MISSIYIKIVDYFSRDPGRYDWIHRILLFGLPYDKVANIIGADANSTILDIGCGPAQILGHIDTYGRYIGIDENGTHIEFASEKHSDGRANFVRGNVLEDGVLPAGETYDVALMLGLMHHLSDDELRHLLSNVASKVGGKLVTFDPVLTKYHWIANLLGFLDRGRHVRNKQRYTELVSESFEIVEQHIIYPRSGMHCFLVNVARPC